MISIILLVYKEANKTKECIDRILKLTDVPFELIIIDNNAEQEIKDYINKIILQYKQDNIKIITHEKNEGIAKSYNIGAKEAKGEYLAYINSDYYLTDEWASQMIKCIEETKAGMIGPMSNFVGNPDQACAHPFAMPNRYIETKCITVLMFLKKKVLEEVGYFDERFNPFTYDDLDIAESIKAKGYKLFVDGFTFIWHDYNHSKESEDYIQIRERNKEYFNKKWGAQIAKQYD